MHYVIETQYVGPNCTDARYIDAHTIAISTAPAVTNSTHEPRISGWCGTTNDRAVYAHGAYATIDDARAAIDSIFGAVRDCEPASSDDDIIEAYSIGKYAPLCADATASWAHEGIMSDISADTTDERISELAELYEIEANMIGCTADSCLEILMHRRRQQLLDERDY